MTYRSGIGAQLGIAEETTWNTRVAPARFLEFVTETVALAIPRIESKGLRTGKRTLRTGQWAAGRREVKGPIDFEVGNQGFGLLFKHMLGSISSTSPGTLTRKYTAVVADSFGLGLTIQVGRPDVSGTVNPFDYTGCKFETWDLGGKVEEFLSLKVGVDGAAEDTSQTLAVASAPAETALLSWDEASITIGGVEVALEDVRFTGNNALKTDRHYMRSGAVTKKEQIAHALLALGGTLTGDFEGMTSYNRFVNGTIATIIGTWTGSQIEAGQNYKVVVTAQNCRFDGTTPDVKGPDILQQVLPFKILDDGVNPPIQIDYYTTDAAY